MILHPGVLALLTGGLISLVMLTCGALVGVRIALRWNPEGAEAEQLSLERRSWLVTTLVCWAISIEVLSLLLFLFTVDIIHPLFVGSMCATGTLNANPVGWHLLWIKLLLFLLGALWLVVNHIDQRLPEQPLTRFKYSVLPPLLLLVIADLVVMGAFFFGLNPEIITSCCGALFSSGGSGVASDLVALPLRPMIIAFYLVTTLFALLLVICRQTSRAVWRVLLALSAIVFGLVSIGSVVSFISVYYYQLPTHHCPFDLLQGHYYFIGYPLYICLFGALLCGLVPLLLIFLQRWAVPDQLLIQTERFWLNAGIILLLGMLILVSWPLVFGRFTMQAYF
jgi:hypothetical protein